MKTTLPIFLTLALSAANSSTTAAGDKEWATAGKVLTGVMAGVVLARAIDPCPPVYVAPSHSVPVCHPPPVHCHVPAYCPPPMVAWRPTPVVVAAPPIRPVTIVPPAPTVVVCPTPVYVQPAPRIIHRVPVYVAPPAVSVHFQWGSHRHRHHGR